MEENLKIYNQLKEVPKEAKKPIQSGRLKGMTDIKPMWRIEKLTETFGPCGIGWKTKTIKKDIIDGANDEKIAIVDIELYVKIDGKWTEPIEGSGGSLLVAKEQKGLHTSDECFKMAYTDALSVACKSLGMGADVYWGDSKYHNKNQTTTSQRKTQYQKKQSNDKDVEEELKLVYVVKMNDLVNATETNYEELLNYFEVESTSDMTLQQLKQAVAILQTKLNKSKEEVF